MAPSQFLPFAYSLADAARRETLRHVAGAVAAENKASHGAFDPVTEADRGAERAMRDLIASTYPDHGICGEEFGDQAGSSAYQWVLDPIDGTRSFTSGLPTWTTLIGLLEGGRHLLGVIDAPRLDERYIGDGATSWTGSAEAPTALRVSDCATLGHARLATTDPFLFEGSAAAAFESLRRRVRTTRYGHDAYAYARLAAGTIDLVVECALKPHDYHPLIPVVRGAGGVFGNWRGGTDFAAGQVIAAATPQLYAAAVEVMRSSAT